MEAATVREWLQTDSFSCLSVLNGSLGPRDIPAWHKKGSTLSVHDLINRLTGALIAFAPY
jgi:hypothetical protein